MRTSPVQVKKKKMKKVVDGKVVDEWEVEVPMVG